MPRPKDSNGRKVLADALDALKRIPGLQARDIRVDWGPPGKPREFDAVLDLRLGKERKRFAVEVKEQVRGTQAIAWIREARYRAEQVGWPFLLVTRYCGRQIAERLAAEGINFLDTFGNAYLQTGRIVVFITNHKPPEGGGWVKAGEGALATPGGLRAAYLMLVEPQREWKIQGIAVAAGIAVGWTHAIVRAMESGGLLRRIKRRGPFVVMDRAKMLARWIADYPVILRPKLELGRFAPLGNGTPLEVFDEPPKGLPPKTTIDAVAARVAAVGAEATPTPHVAFGGTWGADALVHYYRGPTLVLHADPPARQWIKQLGIAPDPRGPITLLGPVVPAMWNHAIPTPAGPVAPPILLYAELRADPDPRAQELAGELARRFPEITSGY